MPALLLGGRRDPVFVPLTDAAEMIAASQPSGFPRLAAQLQSERSNLNLVHVDHFQWIGRDSRAMLIT